MNAIELCTCDHYSCPLHPKNQDQGCTPCIEKNLKMKEIPNCYFKIVDPDDKRCGDTFEDFAKIINKQ